MVREGVRFQFPFFLFVQGSSLVITKTMSERRSGVGARHYRSQHDLQSRRCAAIRVVHPSHSGTMWRHREIESVIRVVGMGTTDINHLYAIEKHIEYVRGYGKVERRHGWLGVLSRTEHNK